MVAPVKWLHAGMAGAPQMNQTHGELIAVLDACLVNGFNVKSITALSRVGNIATATVGSGHGYVPDQVLRVAGAVETDYNGDWSLLSTTGTTVSWDLGALTPATPATGTISAKVAPLGFAKVFNATNRAAYRSPNVLCNRRYLYVNNAASVNWSAGRTIDGVVESCESMSDIDTAVNRAPRDSGASQVDGWFHWYQARGAGTKTSTSHGSYNRSWVIVGDDISFWLLTNPNSTYGRVVYGWGDMISFKPGDTYNTFLAATENYNDATSNAIPTGNSGGSYYNANAATGFLVQRNYLGVGAPGMLFQAGLWSPAAGNYVTSGNGQSLGFPNAADASLILSPCYAYEALPLLRGQLPGKYGTPNNRPYADLQLLDNITGFPDRKFLCVTADAFQMSAPTSNTPETNMARHFFDITGPWQ